MSLSVIKGDSLKQCPYDVAHKIQAKSFHAHLIKCRKNYPGHKYVTCRFDRNHVVPRPEIDFHHAECPSRYLLDRELQKQAGLGKTLAGDIEGPDIVASYLEETDEDWDSAPKYVARQAVFTKEKKQKEEPRVETPYIPPGATFAHKPPQKDLSSNGEENYRRAPKAPSRAAQMSANTISNHSSASSLGENLGDEASPNLGPVWGRGRGTTFKQAQPVVGIVRPSVNTHIPEGGVPINAPSLPAQRYPPGLPSPVLDLREGLAGQEMLLSHDALQGPTMLPNGGQFQPDPQQFEDSAQTSNRTFEFVQPQVETFLQLNGYQQPGINRNPLRFAASQPHQGLSRGRLSGPLFNRPTHPNVPEWNSAAPTNMPTWQAQPDMLIQNPQNQTTGMPFRGQGCDSHIGFPASIASKAGDQDSRLSQNMAVMTKIQKDEAKPVVERWSDAAGLPHSVERWSDPAGPQHNVERWSDTAGPPRSVERWNDPAGPQHSVERWSDTAGRPHSVERWSDTAGPRHSVERWSDTAGPPHSVERWSNTAGPPRSVERWSVAAGPPHSMERWGDTDRPLRSAERWIDTAGPPHHVERWSDSDEPPQAAQVMPPFLQPYFGSQQVSSGASQAGTGRGQIAWSSPSLGATSSSQKVWPGPSLGTSSQNHRTISPGMRASSVNQQVNSGVGLGTANPMANDGPRLRSTNQTAGFDPRLRSTNQAASYDPSFRSTNQTANYDPSFRSTNQTAGYDPSFRLANQTAGYDLGVAATNQSTNFGPTAEAANYSRNFGPTANYSTNFGPTANYSTNFDPAGGAANYSTNFGPTMGATNQTVNVGLSSREADAHQRVLPGSNQEATGTNKRDTADSNEGTSGRLSRPTFRDDSNSAEQESNKQDQEFKDEMIKSKRKLNKKLKQIAILEQRASKGEKLTAEEETKLQKKAELIKQIDEIAVMLETM